ncbi:hypothetical protein B7463_g3506, partial [Scytalidium lignicola]
MPDNPQWYFAYGSNMLSDVFVTRRKIQPLKFDIAAIQTHTLCFNVMGVPYTDPAMGGIRLIEPRDVPLYGIAYLLTPEDMRRVIITEGGGIAYKTETLMATLQNKGLTVMVTTLVGRHRISRDWERLPSKRYMNLLIQGAHEKSLPEQYLEKLVSQPTFEPLHTARFRAGKWLFDSFWQRVARWIERGVRQFKGEEGVVPTWFLVIFDCLLWTMWYYHDFIHSLIWGRGDGLEWK